LVRLNLEDKGSGFQGGFLLFDESGTPLSLAGGHESCLGKA
jgi:hypothetical protein